MGDWYDFEIKMIDGKEVAGYEYCNESTGWQPVFVPMADEQINFAEAWEVKAYELYLEKNNMIKSWVGINRG